MTELTPPGDEIFICYRREDTSYQASVLFDRLVERFGKRRVFRDLDSIPAGSEYPEKIDAALSSCRVFLVLIGRDWMPKDETGWYRIENPDDTLRQEIERAIARRLYIIPVLFDGARMPPASQLPASLQPLTRRQHCQVSAQRFAPDVTDLVDRVAAQFPEPVPEPGPSEVKTGAVVPRVPPYPVPRPARRRRLRRVLLPAGAAAVLLIVGGVLLAARPRPPAAPHPPAKPTVTATVSDNDGTVDGNAFVQFGDRPDASATVTGNVSRAAPGSVARLVARRFPFRTQRVIGRRSITAGTRQVAFPVTPQLETQYQVQIVRSPSATTAVARSGWQTVYVSGYSLPTQGTIVCAAGTCTVTIRIVTRVPPLTFEGESIKRVFFYFAVNLTKNGAAPQELIYRPGQFVSAPTILTRHSYVQVITRSFPSSQNDPPWGWSACTLDSVAQDGLGLPGHHGCGGPEIPAGHGYLG